MIVDPDRPWGWRANPFNFAEARELAAIARAHAPSEAPRAKRRASPLPLLIAPGRIGSCDFLTGAELASLNADPEEERLAYLDHLDREAARDYRVLSDKWVDTRKAHPCSVCRNDIPDRERCRVRVVSAGGVLSSEYTCWDCDSGNQPTESREGTSIAEGRGLISRGN